MEKKEFKCLRAFLNAIDSYKHDGFTDIQRDQWTAERVAIMRNPKSYKLINIHADLRHGVLREYLNGVLIKKTSFE